MQLLAMIRVERTGLSLAIVTRNLDTRLKTARPVLPALMGGTAGDTGSVRSVALRGA